MKIAGFLIASLMVSALSAIGVAVLLAQIRCLTPGAVLRDAVGFLLTRERILIHGAWRFLAYLRPGFHPTCRDVSHLIAPLLPPGVVTASTPATVAAEGVG